MDTPLPLEPSPEQLHELLAVAGAFVERFVAGVADAPASSDVMSPALHDEIRATVGDTAGTLDAALDLVRRGLDEGFNPAGPGFMAYIPGGGLVTAGVADLIACIVNRYVGIWPPAPAMVEIEYRVVRWLCDLFAYPPESRGVLTSGGSMANLSAIVAARHARLDDDVSAGRIYVTDQAHHSVAKAARIAGFAAAAVRVVPRDAGLRMDPEGLEAAVNEDRRAGLRPACVVVSAGTTNTGAIDPLGAIADVAEREGLWLHVDGAYGGFFQLTERGRSRFGGAARADSITLDPHKCMFLPYGTGALLARDGEALRAAHAATGDYLRDFDEDDALPNFGEYSPEFTRSFRGLRVWLPLVLHGVAAFREALDEKLDLARWLHDELASEPSLELPWEPSLTVVTFRSRAGDDETLRILHEVNASRRVFFSSTSIDGRVYIRPCIVVHRTHRDRIEEAAALIRSAAGRAPGSSSP
ncbi:MAG: aspartate aminotransferase family protein [Actinomycetota bacterium]